MDQIALYNKNSFNCSKITTQIYSTSFSLGILSLNKKFRDPIYGIYGFVRFADEIVDTFHEHKKEELIERFEQDTYTAIKEKISLNPILHSFQLVVNEYNIEHDLIAQFLKSMKMDLQQKDYDAERDRLLAEGGIRVVRVPDRAVNVEMVRLALTGALGQ